MAAAQAATPSTDFTFFGTCPTGWDNLTPTQKESCIGTQLIRQIEGHFAWAAAGQLLEQWNSSGEEEYSAVIAHGKAGRFRSFRHHKIPGHELRLLSLSPDKETVAPFIIITSKDKDGKAARETIERLKQHPRLARFSLKYMIRQGNTRLTMGSPTDASFNQTELNGKGKANSSVSRGSANAMNEIADFWPQPVRNQETQKRSENLCGARIAVYTHSGRVRGQKPQVSTIAGVVKIGDRYYALTVAHVFFDNVNSTKSWADSGLYVTSESSIDLRPEVPIPRSSQIYQVVIESLWPHDKDLQDESEIQSTSIGLVAPSLSHRRKDPVTAALPEVIWDAELDWALIELRDPVLWKPNFLTTSGGDGLSLHLPPSDIQPLSGEVLIAAGVSRQVDGHGLGTVGGILLPWSSREIKTWSVESEIAVGDSGSLAICPQNGMVHGLVVAHDSDTLMTYIVPILSVFESILRHFELPFSSMSSLFCITSSNTEQSSQVVEKEQDMKDGVNFSAISHKEQPVDELFSSKLESFTARNVSGQRYIHRSLLIDWLLSNHTSQATYLDLLLDFAYSECIIVPVEARQLSGPGKSSLLVFSMLLELGRGDLIHYFLRSGLTDSKLPFPMTSLKQAKTSGDRSETDDLTRQIFERQWAYCPLTFDLGMGVDLPSSTVIPIQQRQQINSKGGTASIWQILVPEEFVGDSLRQEAASAKFKSVSKNAGSCYQFALKTFATGRESLFDNERDAFRALRKNTQLIRCLGDYTYGEEDRKTYNILLEYGEADLDEYFSTTPPPALASEIIAFWEDLFKVAEAVRDLHSFEFPRAGVERKYYGWHADIKPDNILRVNGVFKLADFGFASFGRMDEERALLRGGTVIYGAPECVRAEDSQTRASRAIDIWSLGCVFSEAACWVVLGESGIQQFSSLREQATKSLSREQISWSSTDGVFRPPGRQFHDGINVLKEVRQWHEHLRTIVRQTDVITGRVLDLIDKHMLISAPEYRYTATAVCDECKNLLARAKRDLPPLSRLQSTTSALLGNPKLRRHSDSVDVQPLVLPQVSMRPAGCGPTTEQQDSQSPIFRSSGRFHHIPTLPGVLPLSQADVISPPQSNGFIVDVRGSDPALYSSAGEWSHTPGPRSPPTLRDSGVGPTTPELSSRTPWARSSVEKSHPVPTMTIAEARKAIDRERKSSLFSRFKAKKGNEFLSKHIQNRDLVFLVDNGETMAKHWDEVTNVLETLTTLLRGQDPDGLTLTFTFGKASCHSPSAQKLKKTMLGKEAKPSHNVHTNMASALGKNLSEYLQYMTSSRGRPRYLSLYVLTDGIWSGTLDIHAVDDVMAEFSTKLEKLDGSVLKSERRVGIQFVQFGNEPAATYALRRLDRELMFKGIPDMIDTEPATGNVWKMLLGNFVDDFDYAGDEDREAAEDEIKRSIGSPLISATVGDT